MHLVIGCTKETRIRCYGNSFNVGAFLNRMSECNCMSHEFARAWSAVTDGESYIVHAIPVGSPRGAAMYLAKYMQKTFDADRSELLGMKRRWSTSRGWPVEKRARMSETRKGEWIRHWWKEEHVDMEEFDLDPEVGQLVQTEKQKVESGRTARQRYLAVVKRSTLCGG